MTTKTLTSLLIGALLAVAASAYADERIQVAMEDGKTRAQFSVGDSQCVLVDDQIRCSRTAK
jgi:hypothetical protein